MRWVKINPGRGGTSYFVRAIYNLDRFYTHLSYFEPFLVCLYSLAVFNQENSLTYIKNTSAIS